MEMQGKVIWASAKKEGKSKRTGSLYVLQKFVIESTAATAYPERVMIAVLGEDRLSEMHLAVGDEGKLTFEMHAREFKGKWYNNIEGLAFDRSEKAQTVKSDGDVFDDDGEEDAPPF